MESGLDRQIHEGIQLQTVSADSQEDLDALWARAKTWHEVSRELIRTHHPSLDEEIGDFNSPVFMSHATLETKEAALRREIRMTLQKLESIKKRLPLLDKDVAKAGPDRDGWILPRLLDYVQSSLIHARLTNTPTAWGKVSRDAVLFLENEIRIRTGITEKADRQNLAALALKSNGAVLRLNKIPAVQDGWMYLVKGLFAVVGNPAAHTIRHHSESYAMGVVGAVTTVLVMLDDELGEPPSSLNL